MRRSLVVVAGCVAVSAALLALAGATGSSGLAVAGCVFVVGARAVWEILRWRSYDPMLKAITLAALGLVAFVILGSFLID